MKKKKVITNYSPQKTKKKPSEKEDVTKVQVVRRLPTEQERRQFAKEKRRAREYVTDKQKTAQLLKEAIEKANRNKGALRNLWNKLTALFRLINAWVKGEYTDVSLKTILWVTAAIIYFVNPFDAIPDFIPGGPRACRVLHQSYEYTHGAELPYFRRFHVQTSRNRFRDHYGAERCRDIRQGSWKKVSRAERSGSSRGMAGRRNTR